MRYKFICKEHEDHGTLGWVLANMPAFDPLQGMAVAHDILEHWPNDDSTTGELLALGASIHVRNTQYSTRRREEFARRYGGRGIITEETVRPSFNGAGEVAELLYKIACGQWQPLRDYPTKFVRRGLSEFAFEECVHYVRLVRRELYERGDDDTVRLTQRDARNVLCWLATGYQRAVRRYKGISEYELIATFEAIENAADKALKDAEENDELHVSLMWRKRPNGTRYADLTIERRTPWGETETYI